MIKRDLFVVIVLLFSFNLKSENVEGNLIVKTQIYDDGVAIRWTPVSLHMWRKWSKSGYRLERYTVAKEGEAINNGLNVLIGGESILPFSEEQWDTYMKMTPEAGLVHHCLMNNEKKEVGDKESYLSSIDEENKCYIFSMLAIQKNFECALAGGIGFIDKSTNRNETYLYKLYPVDGGEKDTVLFVVDMNEVSILPTIENFKSGLKDNRILLEWPAKKYQTSYFGFRIEKSLDNGVSYQPVNELPFVPVSVEGGSERRCEQYCDTVSLFYQPIKYRIRGLSYFGQYGPPSFCDSLTVFPETKAFPEYLKTDEISEKGISVQWMFGQENEKLIKGFKVLTCDSSDGEFIEQDTVIIDVKQRSFELRIDQPVAYIKVAAVSLNNTFNYSFPVMVQQVDSIAPLAPDIISLSIDTAGIVSLLWNSNKERDLMAYQVFRGNIRTEEFSSITQQYYHDTFIRDTLFMGMIRDSIYYKLIALDNRYNESVYSKIFAARIPDRIPPSPPVINEISVFEGVAIVHWHKSNSNDVAYYRLVREMKKSGEIDIKKVDTSANSFNDSGLIHDEHYLYTLYAVDFSGLVSKSANAYEIKTPSEKIMPGVKIKLVINDTTKNYLTFFWNYKYDDEVLHYRILQANSDGSLQTIGNAEGGKSFLNYYYLKPYAIHEYYIIAYFKNGRRSKIEN